MNTIWTITAVGIKTDNGNSHSRCWGFEFTETEAREFLSKTDTEAGYYTHAVIEEMQTGYVAMAKKEFWFEYDHTLHKWIACDKPTSQHHIVNYAMG